MGIVTSVVRLAASAGIIAGSVAGYYPQYREIAKLQNADGFSTLVSLILIISNTVRVFFWFGKGFEITLLYQAFAVIVCQLGMISLCTSVRVSQQRADRAPRRLTDLKPEDFWHWDDFASYLMAEALFCIALVVLAVLFMQFDWYVEGLGTVALGIEALLGVPQVYRNFIKKSTAGLNAVMIGSWLAGDIFKVVFYYLAGDTPAQFMYCGLFQVCTDLIIVLQMRVLYTHSPDQASWIKRRLREWMVRLFAPTDSAPQQHHNTLPLPRAGSTVGAV